MASSTLRPGSFATTLGDVLRVVACVTRKDTVTPSGVAFPPRVSARRRSVSRSCPPSAARSTAASLVSHDFSRSTGSPSAEGRNTCSPIVVESTTPNGYVADASVWMRMTPAAPCRSASSNLYVQRP